MRDIVSRPKPDLSKPILALVEFGGIIPEKTVFCRGTRLGTFSERTFERGNGFLRNESKGYKGYRFQLVVLVSTVGLRVKCAQD